MYELIWSDEDGHLYFVTDKEGTVWAHAEIHNWSKSSYYKAKAIWLEALESFNKKGIEVFAETIFVNGKVVIMDAADTIAQAVAIKDDLILKTGSSESLRSLTGPHTKVIDLRGRTLTPGLVDAHIHPQQMGFYGRMVPFIAAGGQIHPGYEA